MTGSPAVCGSKTDRRGFTLIEILVAFTVLAVALGGLMTAFSSQVRTIRAVEPRAAAVLQARSLLERIGGDIPLREGEESGAFADGFGWTTRIHRYALAEADTDEPPAVVPYQVEVTVEWGDGASLTLSSLRLGPP